MVHVVQIVATHGLCQLPDVDMTRFCGVLAPALDVLLLVAVKHLFGPLCENSEHKHCRHHNLPSLHTATLLWFRLRYLAEGSGMVSGLASTWTPFSHSCRQVSARR